MGKKPHRGQGGRPNNTVVIKKYTSVGEPDAESDNQLEKVFMEREELDVLTDVNSSKSVIIGRTGSGKSALIRRMEEECENVFHINPESISVKYISNSTIINYFRDIGVNIIFFYKIMWKHIFIVEILKLYFEGAEKKQGVLDKLKNRLDFRDKSKNRARERAFSYLSDWSNEFWEKQEYRIKELEKQITGKLVSELGFESFDKLKAKIGGESSSSEKFMLEVKHKTEAVINEVQASELFDLIELLKELFDGNQKKLYLLIDDLDKEWAPTQIVYDLIATMVDVIKEFRGTFKSVKIVASLRDNLHQLVFSGREHRGGQREKFSSLYLHLEWTRKELKELIDIRLKYFINSNISISSIFEKFGKNRDDGFEYVLDRTFLRPRDVISFVNHILEHAHNRTSFSYSVIKAAEQDYSLERLTAIEDEWKENYGNISELIMSLRGMHHSFRLATLDINRFYDAYFSKNFKGEVKELFEKVRSDLMPDRIFMRDIIFILFKMGVVGVKRSSTEPVLYFYDKSVSLLNPQELKSDYRIYIHKAFYSVLGIVVKELEPDLPSFPQE
jgi:hypothetical protein